MKTSVMNSTFKAAVKTASATIPKKTALPILSHVLLNAQGSKLAITATDCERAIKVTIPANSEIDGAICLPVSGVDTKVNKNDGRLDVEIADPASLTVSMVDYKHKVTSKGLSSDEYPVIQDVDGLELATIDGKLFKQALKFLLEATDTDDSRPGLGVVHMVFEASDTLDKGEITLTSTDSMKIHRAIITEHVYQNYTILIPARSFEVLAKVLPDSYVTLYAMPGNRAEFGARWQDKASNEVEFSTILADVKAMDYDSVIPARYFFNFQVEAKVFKDAVKHCKIINPTVYLNIKRHSAEIGPVASTAYLFSEDPAIGDATDEFRIDYTDVPPTRRYAFEATNLLDALNTFEKVAEGAITVRFNVDSAPVFIEVTEGNLALSAAIATKQPVPEYKRHAWTIDSEAHKQTQEMDEASREYETWVRDTLGLPASIYTRDRLYSGQNLMNYRGQYRENSYDMIEVYEYLYQGGPIPQWQAYRRAA